jgi:hypothetical protein
MLISSVSVEKMIILAVKTILSSIVLKFLADGAKDEQQLTDLVT